MTRKYLELENAGAGFEELEKLTLGGLRKAVVEGECEERKCNGRTDCRYGKRTRKDCKEIIEQMMNEMEELLKGAPARL